VRVIVKWWTITNQSNESAELLLYGDIGDGWLYDNSSRDFANALQGLRAARNITIRINSPGGEVTAAQAIYSLIKSHPASVTVVIDGIAASAASLIVMAGDRIVMPSNALLMIHNPMIWAVGDHGDMIHAADTLEKVKDTMINVYSEKTGKDSGALSEMMDNETWMTAAEAYHEGFIDQVDAGAAVDIRASNDGDALIANGLVVDLKKYRNMPAAVVAAANERPMHGRGMEGKRVNVDQIKAEHPDVYTQIFNAGITAERERIKGIDNICATGYEAVKSKAKYETFEQAGKVAIDILNAQAARVAGAAHDIGADVMASNVNDIPMGDAPEQEPTAESAIAKKLIQKAVEAANANMKG
jgi:ATP-dependent Clp endopeptidase proteolytic subunit ClpP